MMLKQLLENICGVVVNRVTPNLEQNIKFLINQKFIKLA